MAISRFLGELIRANPALTRQKKCLFYGGLLIKPGRLSGNGFLAGQLPDGIVTVSGAAASRNVRLYPAGGMTLLRERRSAADGTYLFAWIDENRLYLLLALDDGEPPQYQPYAHDFAVPVVSVIALTRTDTTARAILQHNYLVGTRIRVLRATPDAWNIDAVVSAVGPGWLEFACSDTLPAVAGGTILLQRRYGS